MLRRLIHSLGSLLALSFLAYSLLRLAPGEFFDDLRLDPQVSAKTVEGMRNERAPARGFWPGYFVWMGGIARGDFGESLAYRMPVSGLIAPRALATLRLSVVSSMLAWLLALGLGILCARRPGSIVDRALISITGVLLLAPDLILVYVFFTIAAMSGLLAIVSGFSPYGLVTVCLFPALFRHVRSALLSAKREPYIAAAADLGVHGPRLWWGQILLAAAHPLIALFGLSLSGLFSVTLLIEALTSWPGLGAMFLEAILARDTYLVLGAILLAGSFVVLGNLAAELLLLRVDARLRGR